MLTRRVAAGVQNLCQKTLRLAEGVMACIVGTHPRSRRKIDQRESSLLIMDPAEELRRLQDYHLQRRPDLASKKVTAQSCSIRPAHDGMRVQHRLPILPAQIPGK